MNEKAKVELSLKDQHMLTGLLAQDSHTPLELEALEARKEYLTAEECKKLGLGGKAKKPAKKTKTTK